MTDRKPCGIKVYPLAEETYLMPGAFCSPWDRYAIGVNANNGETFLIHSEGVCYPVTHDKPWRFNDYVLEARFFTIAEVRQFKVQKPVDLAKWVAEFGARLESNFHGALMLLTQVETHEKESNPKVYELLGEWIPNVRHRIRITTAGNYAGIGITKA